MEKLVARANKGAKENIYLHFCLLFCHRGVAPVTCHLSPVTYFPYETNCENPRW